MNNNNNVIIRLYLVRHGETIANLHNNVIGQTDSPLTELGKQQAMALGKWLAISNPFIIHSLQQQQQQGEREEEQTSSSSSMVTNSKNDYFWRIYSSDLGRTKHTTQLILQQYYTYIHNNNHHHTIPTIPTNVETESQNESFVDNNNVIYDSRLREIARGVRQGLSKQFTYNDAMKIYNDGLHPIYNKNDNNNNNNNINNTLPLNESDDDGWDRIYTLWLNDLIYDLQKDVISQTQSPITNTNSTTTIQQQQEQQEEEEEENLKYYNILVVTHGALLRVFLNRLLGTDRIQKECNHQNGTINHNTNNNNNDSLKWLDETQQFTNTVSPTIPTPPSSSSSSFVRLHVPNTSLTMIDIPLAVNSTEQSTITPNITYPNNDNIITIQRFLSTEHYELINKC